MLKTRTLLGIICLCFCALNSYANVAIELNKSQATHLTIKNGLAHNGASCLYRDSRDYLWIGTYDGLNRYNGYEITTYKNKTGVFIMQSNRIRTINEDCHSRLWIGTEEGVTIYDYRLDYFKLLPHQQKKNTPIIREIYFTKDSLAVCVSENCGILIYDMQGNLKRVDKITLNPHINCTALLQKGNFIVGNPKGLYIYNYVTGNFKEITSEIDYSVTAIAKKGKNQFIIGYGKRMKEIVLKQYSDQNYYLEQTGNTQTFEHQIMNITFSKAGDLWVGCDMNKGFYSPQYSKTKNPQLFPLLEKDRLSSILDNDNQLCISTFNNGVYIFSTQISTINTHCLGEIYQPNVIELDSVHSLINTPKTNFIYNLQSKTRQEAVLNYPTGIKNGGKIFFKDLKNQLWLIARNDKNVNQLFKVKNQKLEEVKSPLLENIRKSTFYQNTPILANVDFEGNFWIAYTHDIYRIKINKSNEIKAVESILDNPTFKYRKDLSRTRVIYSDPTTQSVWIGTNRKGLFKIDISKKQSLKESKIEDYKYTPQTPNTLSSNFISCMLRQKNGQLWVGTEQGGICKVDESSKPHKFKALTEQEGLSNNVVKSMVEDCNGQIWIGTNIGLNLFNPKDQTFRVFRGEDGLLAEDFWYSAYIAHNQEIVMSSVNSFCSFKPNELMTEEALPKLHFDGLRIFNTEIRPNRMYGERKIISQHLSNGDTLSLAYNENSFTIYIDALYQEPSTNHYLYYQLLPQGKEWIKIPAKNRALSFNNLDPGKYKLVVKASNAHNGLTKPIALHITVVPPLWKSPMAYFMYILLIVAISGLCIYILMYMQNLSHKLELEHMETTNNTDKLRYFSNISHELKTPLSLILAPLSVLRERFSLDVEVCDKLDIIRRQSKKMLELIELTHGVEISDLKLISTSKTTLSFDAIIQDMKKDFVFMAKHEQKNFTISSGSNHQVLIEADRGMIEKILNNLLSNAFKHTKATQSITLSYQQIDESLQFTVSDTGYGIDQEDLPHIFERFYQAKRTNGGNMGGTGIGLTFSKRLVELHQGSITVESTLGEGTTFTVTLPIGNTQNVEKLEVLDEIDEFIPHSQEQIIGNKDLSELKINTQLAAAKVFLVEDNQELRSFLEEIIGNYFQVHSFANGVEMFEVLEHEWPDLIISDVMMPEMDGYELCKRVKQDIKTSHIPVILLTACTTVDDKIMGLNSGADAYIPKPFYPKHVITRIETLLINRQLLRERFQIGIPLVYGKDRNTSAKDNEFMCQLYELFNENLDNEEINLDQFARKLGQNRSLFFKKVKTITNTSPYELLKEYRLKRAAELLQTGEYSVKEVCMMTGFKDRSHFSRLFKDHYQVSPSKYMDSDQVMNS